MPSTPGFAGTAETTLLRNLVAMCSHLSTLASQTAELAPIVEILADGIECTVAVVDPALEVLAWARVAEPGEIIAQLRGGGRQATLRTVLAAAARNRRPLAVPGSTSGQMTVIAPVFVGEDVAGYVLTLSPRHPPPAAPGAPDFTEDMRLLAIQHAAMVCGVVLGRDLVVTAAAGRARQELLEGLLIRRDRSDPELERWSRHLGLDPSCEHCVMTFEIAQDRPGPASSPIERVLTRNAPGAVVANRTDEVVAIVPLADNGAPPAEQARKLARVCLASEGQHPSVTGVGIGGPCSSAAEIARSYAEARRALTAGRRMGQAQTVSVFAELGIHRLLLRVPDVGDLRSFADEVLGVLAEEERSTNIAYVATLSAYFRENRSPARASQRLHVHPNTVSYRIRRIEELTGLSFNVYRDRLMAEVAMEILEGLEGAS
ncbi:helix-turn-helix domain-containing protein [Streptomyces sp. NPDC007084]|uniref:PucR family transcriptional regulator n=1 Tax=Streptomyces sp. NPDC007084 TaxID=3154313 RepID=UPI003453B850